MSDECKIQSLMLFTRYVEDAHLAGVPAWCQTPFDSVREAVVSLGKTILEADRNDYAYVYRSPCCRKAMEEHQDYEFCPTCGKRLKQEPYDDDSGPQLMEDFLRGTNDSTAGLYDYMEEKGWSVGSQTFHMVAQGPIGLVYEQAEHLLWNASQGRLDASSDELNRHCKVVVPGRG